MSRQAITMACSVIGLAAVAIIGASALWGGDTPTASSDASPDSAQTLLQAESSGTAATDTTTPAATQEFRYILKEYEGQIAVFSADDTETPQMVTDIDISMLRQTDQQALKEGIYANGMDEVLRLIEDFGS